MDFAIIAAGESSRIKSEGLTTAKPMIKIGGETIIHRLIRIARANGFSRIFIVINENEPELINYLKNTDFGINLQLLVKNTESSMHSLLLLSDYLKSEHFCLTTGDTVFSEDEFRDFLAFCRTTSARAGVLAVTDFIDDEKPLCVRLNSRNEITDFSDVKDQRFATGGIYYLSTQIFGLGETAMKNKIIRLRNFLRLLLQQGYILKTYRFSKIIDIDHIKDIQEAEKFLKGSNGIRIL